ncbi:protein TIME FOR COFFEE [Cajanus cajan]|uniref:protein TIME FOR COFFEE n=1 Tax=Cajanus cajan TaxID=3821 RepID=UPI00098D9C26|nr:protein TIME FOR COFFEE [Cajanus cajan]
MDRTRESRKSSMATSTNGFPKRRHRTIALRDSSEEGAVELLREGASKRGRNRDRDRDRDSANRNKRRRGSHSQSTEDSVGNEQGDDVVDAGASKIRSPNNTMSFAADQNHRRTFAPAKPPPFKITEEMIGVTVPRKARSASAKRSHESWVSASGGGGCGGGEELNLRQRSNSPGGHSVEPASPSSSSVSVRKKMKEIEVGPKTSKSSSSDIEIEIAELLYGLKTSKNHDSSKKLEASVNHQASVSCHSEDVEKKKMEENDSSTMVLNNLAKEFVRIQSEQTADVDFHDGHENGPSEAPKENFGEDKMISGAGFGDASADGRSVSPTRESPSCCKLDADKQDSVSRRVMSAVSEAKTQRVGKFEIDLMAPPPMGLSPEGDDLSRGDFISENKALALDIEMKRENSVKLDRPVKKEKTLEEIEEAEMISFKEKLDVLKHNLEKLNNENDIKTSNKLEEQDRNKELPTISSNPKVEKTAQSTSMPLSTAESGRPSSLSPIGYKPPLQPVVKTNKTTGTSTPQHVNFVLSQPRPSRCATHYYIACNILHQQFTKPKPPLPVAISGSLGGTKPNNVHCVPSAESMAVGKQSQKQLPIVNQNAAQEKGWAATSNPSLTAAKTFNNANPVDSAHRVQLVLQQGPNPGSTSNLVHGPAFLYPPGQHQASVTAATNQAGAGNSPNSTSSYNKSHSSVGGSLGTSSTLPVVAPAISFSYPNFSANGSSPYMTIVHNNGYSFPFSTSLGATAAIRGASPPQATHVLNVPFYSSQSFHPQQPPQSQALVQPSYLNASTSSSSSSHKQSQGAQVNGSNVLTSTTMEQQSQKRQTSLSHLRKHETEMGGGNAPLVANRTSYPQKNVHGQNFTIPVQPVNFSFKPSTSSNTVVGNGGTFGDKQQQQQALKGGVENIPSQAFAISFAAFNGTSVPSNLNFSSMAQNPVILQSLPDIAWQGYQAASTPQTTQQKNYSITEAKSGGNSSHQDDEKKITHAKSSSNGPTTLVFDNSSKNLNFVLSSTNGNWSGHTIASTAMTSVPLSSNASSSQQPQHLLQLPKQHAMQQQQPAMTTRYKPSSTNSTPATKFANNAPVFSQTLTQCKSSNQASHTKASGRTTDSHGHHSSIIASNTPTLKNFSQEQGRVLQGHMQISFGGNYMTSLPHQGQQLLSNNQPLCTTAGGNVKSNSEGSKVSSTVNTSQLQQTENSAGSGQKSSPVCGRNVPSILSSCPSQLSELKY